MSTKNEQLTELVAFRITPTEKLTLIKAARRSPYRGSMSLLLRDLLTQNPGFAKKGALPSEGVGALAAVNN